MFLKKINLFNYKNFSEIDFEFEHKAVCFVGKNGIGKTNILDAIYHLAYGKSYFNPLAIQNVKHGQDFFVIEGEFIKTERTEIIVCSFKKGQKKIIKRNGKSYDKFSEHIGFIPLVIISPADSDLIVEGSETRRKFIDSVIAQLDSKYLNFLIQYQKTIAQRNALLKYFAINQEFNVDTLSIYDQQLSEFGNYIFEKRKHFLSLFIPVFDKYYKYITDNTEKVAVKYESALNDSTIIDLLKLNIAKDRVLQYTSVGIHKDDLLFEIEDYPIKKFGSQGQQKSFLIALKLAQFEFVKQQSGVKPILLFDDIFDKLDQSRVAKIVAMVNDNNFGQIFISDTHANRTEQIVQSMGQSYQIFNL
jgi:DNA replication and repair protein RecF